MSASVSAAFVLHGSAAETALGEARGCAAPSLCPRPLLQFHVEEEDAGRLSGSPASTSETTVTFEKGRDLGVSPRRAQKRPAAQTGPEHWACFPGREAVFLRVQTGCRAPAARVTRRRLPALAVLAGSGSATFPPSPPQQRELLLHPRASK